MNRNQQELNKDIKRVAIALEKLVKLMTKLNYHQEKEEYEECAKIKKEIDKLNKKLDNL